MSAATAFAPTGVVFDPLKELTAYEHTRLCGPLADHIASKRSAGRAEGTLEDRVRYVGGFALMFPTRTVDQVTPFDVMHWESEGRKRGLATSTLAMRRTHLHDFFEWCINWDLIDKNPMRRLEAIKAPQKKVYDVFTDAEVELMVSLPLLDGALMGLLLFGGLRKSEAAALQVKHILPEPMPGQVAVYSGKGGKDRVIHMSARLARMVAELTLVEGLGSNDFFWYTRRNQGRTLTRSTRPAQQSMQYWWVKTLAGSGVRFRKLHMTRHTFATRWLRKGGRLETLSMVMGHSSIRTTFDLYAHLDTRDVIRDMALMED